MTDGEQHRTHRHRPWQLWVAVAMVALEALELVASAVFFGVLAQAGDAGLRTSLISLAAMFALLGLGLAAVVQGLYRMHRWARPAAVAWQILLALFGLSVLGSGWVLPVAALVPAIVCLVALFSPPTLRAYDAAIIAHEEAARQAAKQVARDTATGKTTRGKSTRGT